MTRLNILGRSGKQIGMQTVDAYYESCVIGYEGNLIVSLA